MAEIPRSAPDFAAAAAFGRPRSFLFLQGPLSRFFDELGRALIARGHRVHRVDLHLGEQLFWRLPASRFRGRFDEWRGYIADALDAHRVTDMILVGDRRPYHIVAAEEARARGIAVFCTDFGYLRPGWITFERDGMTTYSRLPRDPAAIRALAAATPPPALEPHYDAPFRLVAALDVAFTVPQVLGRPFYPHYRWHGIYHPFAEYAGWLLALARRRIGATRTIAAKARLAQQPGSYFLLPLQLATDFQIRAHSPYADLRDGVRDIVRSFVASGSKRTLAVVAHPLDNGLIDWRRLVGRLVRGTEAAARIVVLDDGVPPDLLANAAGIVTINSTVGISGLYQGVPVKALGSAVFDIPGLTCQDSLDRFWHDPVPPDRELAAAFLRALAGTTQFRGGFHEPAAKARAIREIVARLERESDPLPPLSDAEIARRRVRPIARTIVVAGASRGIGLALARAYAEPGTRLCLIGGSTAALATAAGDCRRRGALVETIATGPADGAEVASRIAAIDRETPADLVIAADDADSDTPIPGIGHHLAAALIARGGLADRLWRRGHGRIALVGGAAAAAAQDRAGLPGVLIARRGWLATMLMVRGADPRLVAVATDRAAALIRRGIERGSPAVAFPGPAMIGWRALRLAPDWLREWPRRVLIEASDRAAEAADEVPLPGEPTQAD